MTKKLLSEHDFGRSSQFKAVWNSMEELLLTYDESPYVSQAYQASLEGRSAAARCLPRATCRRNCPTGWSRCNRTTCGSLSVLLITDLLRIETNEDRAVEIAGDMAILVDDLLLSGTSRIRRWSCGSCGNRARHRLRRPPPRRR